MSCWCMNSRCLTLSNVLCRSTYWSLLLKTWRRRETSILESWGTLSWFARRTRGRTTLCCRGSWTFSTPQTYVLTWGCFLAVLPPKRKIHFIWWFWQAQYWWLVVFQHSIRLKTSSLTLRVSQRGVFHPLPWGVKPLRLAQDGEVASCPASVACGHW